MTFPRFQFQIPKFQNHSKAINVKSRLSDCPDADGADGDDDDGGFANLQTFSKTMRKNTCFGRFWEEEKRKSLKDEESRNRRRRMGVNGVNARRKTELLA